MLKVSKYENGKDIVLDRDANTVGFKFWTTAQDENKKDVIVSVDDKVVLSFKDDKPDRASIKIEYCDLEPKDFVLTDEASKCYADLGFTPEEIAKAMSAGLRLAYGEKVLKKYKVKTGKVSEAEELAAAQDWILDQDDLLIQWKALPKDQRRAFVLEKYRARSQG